MLSLSNPLISPLPLIVLTAAGYFVATVGMKGAAGGALVTGGIIALLGFLLAFAAEVLLMRNTHLSVLYILIIGVETVLVLGFAMGIGEGLSFRQAIGAGLVLTGLAIVAV
ncbi:5-aminolevulinate synthase [Sagittula sp. S175]|uniref:5-aminolevulinate synthase n=1 Tax=Sagittula sp. S175 TaxID=3415129 RepID=UPI003C79FEB9